MKKLLLAALICTVIGLCLMGCKKHAATEHPAAEHEHSKSEHPK